MELASALFTDTLTVDKPGAKKYFQTQGSIFLPTIMNELRCVILLRPEIEEEEEEEVENYGGETTLCRVQTNSGVLISVSKVDICSFGVDAVVNAANEDLDHIGGLALALLRAAGPQLQRESSDYVAKNGRLRPGDAIITDAYNLPCKHVVHAVGPRFSDFDRKTSVSRLKTAVRESLRQAEMANCSSVALPAISSGIFGFPVDLCAETIAQAVREHCDICVLCQCILLFFFCLLMSPCVFLRALLCRALTLLCVFSMLLSPIVTSCQFQVPLFLFPSTHIF
uniref:Macro domain-containing protein n=1 Tax=Pundamilia nyererei TaxID=303518 RepID=A0A3B4F3U3_9CICH